MSKPTPGIKMPYFRPEQYPLSDGFRCVEILIPDAWENMALLAALLKLPTRAFNWLPSDDARFVLAQQWAEAYNLTDWEQCMNCDELQACIQPLLDAQTLQFQQMINISKFGSDVQPGVPLTPTQRGTDLAAGTNPTCDLAITWAQCQQVIAYGDGLIKQGIALAESATNDLEILQVFASLPVIDELGADAVVGYIETFQEGIADNYIAQASPTYIEETQCALFCLAKADCTITPDMPYELFKKRVLEHFGDDPLEAFVSIGDLFAYVVDQDIDGTIIADVMMLVIFGGGVLAQAFLGDAGTKPLEVLLQLAVNDANNDYLLLCTTCPECTELDFTGDAYSALITAENGDWVDGEGYVGECFNSTPYYYNGTQLDGNLSGINDVISLVVVIEAETQGGTPGSQYFLEIDGLGIVDEKLNVDGTVVLAWEGAQIDAPEFFIGAYSSRDPGSCIGDAPVIVSLQYCTQAEA